MQWHRIEISKKFFGLVPTSEFDKLHERNEHVRIFSDLSNHVNFDG